MLVHSISKKNMLFRSEREDDSHVFTCFCKAVFSDQILRRYVLMIGPHVHDPKCITNLFISADYEYFLSYQCDVP